MNLFFRACAGAVLLAGLAGCATTNMGTPGDPLERMNRGTHRFNTAVDNAVLRPVAVGYRDHVPGRRPGERQQFPRQPRVPDHDRQQPAAAQGQGHAERHRPLRAQHDDRHRRPVRPRVAVRHSQERRGLRADAGPLGRAGRALCRPAVLRALDGAGRARDLRRLADRPARRRPGGSGRRVDADRPFAGQSPGAVARVRRHLAVGVRPVRFHPRCLAAAARIPRAGRQHAGHGSPGGVRGPGSDGQTRKRRRISLPRRARAVPRRR